MTKKVRIGNLFIGGGERIAVQSMTTEKTSDTERSIAQIKRLEAAGCDIVRVAVQDEADARALPLLKRETSLPIVADVHFSVKLAVLAVENGADKLRINPGNIGSEQEIASLCSCVKAHGVPVRVGANSGSLGQEFLLRYGRSAKALALSALNYANFFEKYGVEDLVLSVKSSSVPLMLEAYRYLFPRTEYPLHLGVTEAGGGLGAVVKSAVGIGALLVEGIGDTVRVSLSDDPVREVETAHEILRACGLERDYVEVVSCPTCGRCRYDCMAFAERVRERVRKEKKRLKLAVMGCVVNGPGEASDADLGIAGGEEECLLFSHGKPFQKAAPKEAELAFFERLDELLKASL